MTARPTLTSAFGILATAALFAAIAGAPATAIAEDDGYHFNRSGFAIGALGSKDNDVTTKGVVWRSNLGLGKLLFGGLQTSVSESSYDDVTVAGMTSMSGTKSTTMRQLEDTYTFDVMFRLGLRVGMFAPYVGVGASATASDYLVSNTASNTNDSEGDLFTYGGLYALGLDITPLSFLTVSAQVQQVNLDDLEFDSNQVKDLAKDAKDIEDIEDLDDLTFRVMVLLRF